MYQRGDVFVFVFVRVRVRVEWVNVCKLENWFYIYFYFIQYCLFYLLFFHVLSITYTLSLESCDLINAPQQTLTHPHTIQIECNQSKQNNNKKT